MSYDFSSLKKRTEEVSRFLSDELSGIRTGMATPAILDSIQVEVYGSRVSVRDISSISIEDPRTLRVSPWDISQLKAIEKSLTVSNLGVSVSTDEKGLRVHFPELTSERRVILGRLVKEKLEEARVSLRLERDKVWSDIQKMEKEGEMSEDEKFKNKDSMQKIIDEGNEKLDLLALKKEKEIQN